MKRHCRVAVLLCCLLALWAGVASASPVPARQPNILLLVADDLGLGDLASFHAAAAEQTPNIDTLAAQGMRFSRFYTDSTCSASRAALLTGQHPARLGFHPVARGIAPDITTLPEWLRAQGYRTQHIGKWHIGELDAAALPLAQGFDSSVGFLNQWFLQGPDANGQPQLRAPVYYDPWLQDGAGEWRQYRGYLPDILTQRAVDTIHANARQPQPWLLWFATPLVHGPLHAVPGLAADASEDEKYRAMVRHLDGNIGQLLAALEASGQRDNTIIIFLSDNGAPAKRSGSNAGFSGGKAHYSEGAVRTPMLWVDPQRVMPGSLDERATSIVDIFPTLAARIGKPLPFRTDGVDINSLDSFAALRQRELFWLSRGSGSVLSADKRWRLVQEWVFREPQAMRLSRIDGGTEQDRSAERYWRFGLVADLQQQFSHWLEEVSSTAVTLEPMVLGVKITGNDFLRTPLREWDFFVAVTPPAEQQGEQVLAEQAGVWSLLYRPAQQQLQVTMHGHVWNVPLALPQGCALLGLNADIYDRYTNTGDTQYPTELRLTLNGRELARTEWQIDSLAHTAIAEPTWLGVSASGDRVWRGQQSLPAFFHRADVVGEWPYFIDTARLQQRLCAQLAR
jgi:arylsulfatase A-like enzyme